MENNILKALADNPALITAFRELLESKVATLPGVASANAFSDERLGQIARSRIDGLDAIDQAFKELAKYKTAAPVPERVNRAR